MVRLPLQAFLLGLLFTAVHPEPPNACRENQYLVNNQCCNMCPPGEKLVQDCENSNSTKCHRCGKGEFLSTWNSERYCHAHRYCDHNLGLQVQREGTSETDTTCTCKEGQHCVDEACEECVLHKSCPPGFGVMRIATKVSDTVCEPCTLGFFSNVSSAFEKCHPWTSCELKGLVERRAGTNKTDVLCDVQDRMRALVVVPIVLVVLLAVLLVYACMRKMAEEVDPKAVYPKNKRQDPEETFDIVEDVPGPCPTHPVQETLLGYQPVTQEDGKESRISVQERL